MPDTPMTPDLVCGCGASDIPGVTGCSAECMQPAPTMPPDLDAIRERAAEAPDKTWAGHPGERVDAQLKQSQADVAALLAWGEGLAAELAELRRDYEVQVDGADALREQRDQVRAEITRLRPMETALAAEHAAPEAAEAEVQRLMSMARKLATEARRYKRERDEALAVAGACTEHSGHGSPCEDDPLGGSCAAARPTRAALDGGA
ncbi:hypothetical protein AB0I28_12360 [Phytomonospora sp. NPDC050363]|uniref:hypothetical protein n=1 Tax=Phytomonospora sp. NPDC050363 TaxID=3155642 RepID=UPI0033D04B0B